MVVSVIIVNYKTQKLLLDTINSVFEKTQNIDFEIIVVDNNSDDNSKKTIEEKYGNTVQFIGLKENIGFGRANNEGAKYAKGKFLFFLNSDTILINNAIKILADFLEKNEEVGICGGNLYFDDLSPAHSCMPKRPSVFLEFSSVFAFIPFKILWGKRFDFNTSGMSKEVADIIGADLMIRTDIFKKLGGFSADFFLYFEESELAHRVSISGYKIFSVPDAKIIHLEGKSTTSDIKKRKYALISRKIYYKKTHNYFQRLLIDSIFIVKCFVGIIMSIATKKKEYVKYWLYALKKGMIEIW